MWIRECGDEHFNHGAEIKTWKTTLVEVVAVTPFLLTCSIEIAKILALESTKKKKNE